MKRTAEHNAKIGAANRGKKRTAAMKEHSRQIALARPPESEETRLKKSHSHKARGTTPPSNPMYGESNPAWKGDEISYNGLHSWFEHHWIKTGTCELCLSTGATEWANWTGSYTRDRADYKELCLSCHRLEDTKNPKRPHVAD